MRVLLVLVALAGPVLAAGLPLNTSAVTLTASYERIGATGPGIRLGGGSSYEFDVPVDFAFSQASTAQQTLPNGLILRGGSYITSLDQGYRVADGLHMRLPAAALDDHYWSPLVGRYKTGDFSVVTRQHQMTSEQVKNFGLQALNSSVGATWVFIDSYPSQRNQSMYSELSGSQIYHGGLSTTFPPWLRLRREGTTWYSEYRMTAGAAWTLIASGTRDLGDRMLVGLKYSHATGAYAQEHTWECMWFDDYDDSSPTATTAGWVYDAEGYGAAASTWTGDWSEFVADTSTNRGGVDMNETATCQFRVSSDNGIRDWSAWSDGATIRGLGAFSGVRYLAMDFRVSSDGTATGSLRDGRFLANVDLVSAGGAVGEELQGRTIQGDGR